MPVSSPRVDSEKASQRTRHRRSATLQSIRELVSGNSPTAQFTDEARSTTERMALLEELQDGVKIHIPVIESLAMKADLILPWNKLRIARRLEHIFMPSTLQMVYLPLQVAKELGCFHCI